MSDEMPAHRHIDRGHLLHRFLNLILADVVQACFIRRSCGLGSVRLRDRDDCDLLAVTASRYRRGDLGSHIGDALRQAWKNHNCEI